MMAVAAAENGIEPRQVSFKGAKQAGMRPGRWEPRARKRRPKPGVRLMQFRATGRLPQNRSKYY
jgi:hypothetical protein